jgi:uncharacterized protein YbaP (TraB family)
MKLFPMQRILKYACIALIAQLWLGIASCASALAGDEKGFFWEVKSKTNTLYILGALGMGRREFYPMNATIEGAFSRCSILAVQWDTSDEAKLVQETRGAYYEEPDSLEKHIPEKLYDEVFDYHAKNNMPLETAKTMKPHLLALTLMNQEARNQGFEPEMDAPDYFVYRAKRARKPVVEVEGVKAEFAALDGLPEAMQIDMLRGALAMLNSTKWGEILSGEAAAWSKGDEGEYAELDKSSYADLPGAQELQERLVYARHPAMLEKLETYLKASDTYFVVLAAPHLIGERGLIAALRAKGYQIERR